MSARDRAGLCYGAVTLWQLIGRRQSAGRVTVPAMRIDDAPRFAWRGLMLDSARHYQSPEFIERFIDWMALHKLNVLHWHLTDDQAWRLEIRKYPRLTRSAPGACRPGVPPLRTSIPPPAGRASTAGTTRRTPCAASCVYAADRGITIVPEIEMPGHATATIAAYPQLGVNGSGSATVPADWGIYPNLFNVEDATFAFLEDVLREVMELFPGPVHPRRRRRGRKGPVEEPRRRCSSGCASAESRTSTRCRATSCSASDAFSPRTGGG